MNRILPPALLCLLALSHSAVGQEAKPDDQKPDTSRGDKMLAEYFRLETGKLKNACLADIKTLDDWNAKKGEMRRQLLEMLGLDPLPEKTDLQPQITGKVDHEEFTVEKLHFQSRPGLYVTGNLYVPKKIDKPLPAILYVCGHGKVVDKNNVSLGNKTHYQHHGGWFARNGYVCLTIDTLQLGEIEGIHHGTHRYNMWWWLSRGYTPAGVEAWNCVRALDYLETRPEVDKTRFGVTGRSGGGAYSWWIAAIDDRIKCAVPVAGITDLQNHVVDGCVEGHCDCMYMLNTYQWDYPQVAALVAPRPLLIGNTDTDGIFPLDGVYRTFEQVRRIYRLHEPAEKGASAKVALNITAGGHKDTQELQVHAFRWFDQHLKGEDKQVEDTAVKFFQPEELKVFASLPEDQKNTEIHETFVPQAPPPVVPADKAAWELMRDGWLAALKEKSFRPFMVGDDEPLADPFADPPPAPLVQNMWDLDYDGVHFDRYVVQTRWGPVSLYAIRRSDIREPEVNILCVLDDITAIEFHQATFDVLKNSSTPLDEVRQKRWNALKKRIESPCVLTFVSPRLLQLSSTPIEKKDVQTHRRFYLLGQTVDGQRVFDTLKSIRAIRTVDELKSIPLRLRSHRNMAGIALYASLFEEDIVALELFDLPKSHREGPTFLNVLRYLDMPQAVAMAAERSQVVIYQDDESGWDYPREVIKRLGWDERQLQIRKKPNEQ